MNNLSTLNVTNINVNTTISFSKEINKVELRINYELNNKIIPNDITVSGSYSLSNGVNLNLNRRYKSNGDYTNSTMPGNTNNPVVGDCFPFNIEFDTKLKTFILEIYTSHSNPV